MLADWAAGAAACERVVTRFEICPAVIDVGTHEQDVRGALDEPGARDSPLIVAAAHRLVDQLDCGPPIEVAFTDLGTTVRSTAGAGVPLILRTTAFEVFRFRLGRRTAGQVAALDWSAAPPTHVLDRLFVFGPAAEPLVE